MHGDFTWIDLSTYHVEETKDFYRNIFQWEMADDGSGYVNCSLAKAPCAGIFETPDFLKRIKMPSFWMTYISVTDIDAVVSKARTLGAKIEIEEQTARGKIALIRDPAGAGFTCYQGTAESSAKSSPRTGEWRSSELFVSDLGVVESFYTQLFGWKIEIEDAASNRYAIRNADGKRIGAVQVASNDIKGEKEFWGVFFATENVKETLASITQAGGQIIYDYSNSDGVHYLAHDSQGAAFFVTAISTPTNHPMTSKDQVSANRNLKWRSFIGLLAVYGAILLEADWIWAALFLFWVIPDLKSGTTFFIEPLSRQQNPTLYWAVVLTWLGLSGYLLLNL